MFDAIAPAPGVIVVSRFRVVSGQDDAFGVQARAAIEALSACPGFVSGELAQSTDEADLRLITTRWSGMGAYRRALSSFEVKVAAVPLLSQAVDEPSTYEVVHARSPEGVVEATSSLAADAGEVSLGHAAAPHVPPVDA